ncbi:TetR/AcrR family transcriptional regulator [Nocardia brasiliensis]|uniref:TetR/AcrR family transcriptional regulator n=1 Tax=Nocardia brasiliensis TaxID=37326 RepID=UPI0024583EFB|nr:TetR/AcrR family transcriptional regulator [Nocardia brasiliensis]
MTTTTRTYGGRPVQDRRVDRRRQFLDAGLTVFGESGYRNSSITSVCRAAGLARAQFYELFDNREDLLLAVYDLIQADAREAVLAAAAAATGDATARATAAVTAFAESVGSDPRRAAISFVEVIGVSDRVEQHRIEQRAIWMQFFEAELRNACGPGFAPPGGYATAATGFIGALMALVHRWSTTDPRPPLADLTEVLTRFLISLVT